MARLQAHRGDPELKKYVLYDNFSGGINTTSADGVVFDNEFRNLENVELIEQGVVKNRQGFGDLKVFNDLIDAEEFGTHPFKKHADYSDFYILAFKLVRDNNNILKILRDSTTIDDFTLKTNHLETFSVLFNLVTAYRATSMPSKWYISIEKVTLQKTVSYGTPSIGVSVVGLNGGFFESVGEDSIKIEKLMGLNIIDFEEKSYFSLSDISTTLTGIVEITNGTSVKLINATENAYKPNAYEITSSGFNILNDTPLTYIDTTSGITEIRGIYLTPKDENNTPIHSIPSNGVFTINVIMKGSEDLSNQLKLKFYNEDEDGTEILIDSEYTRINSGSSSLLRYDVKLNLNGVTEGVYVKAYTEEAIPVLYDQTFTDTAEMITHFKNTDASSDPKMYLVKNYGNLVTAYYANSVSPYGYDYLSLPANTLYVDSLDETLSISSVSSGLENLPMIFKNTATMAVSDVVYSGYKNVATHVIVTERNYESTYGYKLGVAYFNSSGVPTNYKLFTTPDDITYTWADHVIADISTYVPDVFKLYKIGTAYYGYNGGENADISDYTEQTITLYEDILSYINFYNIGSSESAKEIESIDLSDIKMITIKNRLVLYSGNTIMFSDLRNFAYFPNFNYVTLPLYSDDSIQKIAYFRGSYIIFTKYTIYRMSGEFLQGDFSITLINDAIGCISPDSVRSINNTLLFLSNDGLYVIKQNYYMEGIENVEKVDKSIKGLIPYGTNYESLLYNEQYWLFVKDTENNYVKTIKQYYNMEYSKRAYPYVVDIYKQTPEIITIMNGNIYGFSEGNLYIYDNGYTDFLARGLDVLEDDVSDYTYKTVILTPNYTLAAPTHDKKFKSIYIKTESEKAIPLYFTIFLNNIIYKTPYEFIAVVNDLGEIEYRQILGITDTGTNSIEASYDNLELSDPLLTQPETTLSNFILGVSKLGLERYQVHKVVVAGKGKLMAIQIEFEVPHMLAIHNYGFLFKLGKVKESV